MIPLEYVGETPAWRIKVVQPHRFRDVPCALKARVFRMPQGALLTALLKLYDVEDQPYFIHRVMDLADDEVRAFAAACAGESRILLLFETMGEQQGFRREISFNGREWDRCLRDGLDYNSGLPVDGDAALRSFLDVFTSISGVRGVEAAWDVVEKRICTPLS